MNDMTRDPIVEEVHRVREQMWDESGGSLDGLIASLRASEAEHRDRNISAEKLARLRREGRQSSAGGHPAPND